LATTVVVTASRFSHLIASMGQHDSEGMDMRHWAGTVSLTGECKATQPRRRGACSVLSLQWQWSIHDRAYRFLFISRWMADFTVVAHGSLDVTFRGQHMRKHLSARTFGVPGRHPLQNGLVRIQRAPGIFRH
jgi:hypothetical protein